MLPPPLFLRLRETQRLAIFDSFFFFFFSLKLSEQWMWTIEGGRGRAEAGAGARDTNGTVQFLPVLAVVFLSINLIH